MVSVISGAVRKPHLPGLMVSVISGAVGKPHLPGLRFMNYIDYDIVVNAKTVPIGGAGFIYCHGCLCALGMSRGIGIAGWMQSGMRCDGCTAFLLGGLFQNATGLGEVGAEMLILQGRAGCVAIHNGCCISQQHFYISFNFRCNVDLSMPNARAAAEMLLSVASKA